MDLFYGANGHYDYTQTPQTIMANLKALGMSMYRATYEGNAQSLTVLQQLAQTFQNDITETRGIQLLSCIDVSMESAPGVLWASEAAAYTYGYNTGQMVANALSPYGVVYYECGNELDAKSGSGWNNRTIANTQGSKPTDFTLANWPILRGIVRGCMDGVRSVQSNALCLSPAFTMCAYPASDMLWNGTNPDGSTGAPQVRWDITSWHSYKAWGNPFSISGDFPLPPTFNLIQYIANAYKKPIFISEWGGNLGETDKQFTDWFSTMLPLFYKNRLAYNILGICIYQLYGQFNILNADGSLFGNQGQLLSNYVKDKPSSRMWYAPGTTILQ